MGHRQMLWAADYDWSRLGEDVQRLGSLQAVADELGVNHRTVWSRSHGVDYQMTRRRGPGVLGRTGEVLALDLLPGSVDMLGRGYEPYDLEWQGLRVNVKTARLGKDGYRFSTVRGRDHCDVMFCIAVSNAGKPLASWFIPAAVAPSGMCLAPHLRSRKYGKYRYS